MYPKHYLDLFPAYERKNQVFVAMSFDPNYMTRYSAFIEDAIVAAGMKPKIVARTTVSDSILTEILTDIGESGLIFADLSGPGGKPSPNVMYEVGIAHATRQPQEVILFRGDTETDSLFDIANVRVKRYKVQDEATTKTQITTAIQDALKEIDLTKSLLVRRVAEEVLADEFTLLIRMAQHGGKIVTSRHEKANFDALEKHLERGILKLASLAVQPTKGGSNLYNHFEISVFGWAVMDYLATRFDSPDLAYLKKVLKDGRANQLARYPNPRCPPEPRADESNRAAR